jgi:hypothetical protein
MKIIVTRDSVAAGDDVDAPHRLEFDVPSEQPLLEILRTVSQLNYLPSILGGKATWSAASGLPLAVFAQQWRELKLLSALSMTAMQELDYRADGLYVHFSYHAQIDPDVVFGVLNRLRLKSF